MDKGREEMRVRLQRLFCSTAAFSLTFAGAVELSEEESPVIYVYAGQWGKEGDGEGEFRYPKSVAVAPNGNVYVSDSASCRIQYFTKEGSYLGRWGSEVSGAGEMFAFVGKVGGPPEALNYPTDVAITSKGDVYVADAGALRIKYFTPNGSYIGGWEEATRRNSAWCNLALSPSGDLYVVDYDVDFDKIRVFSPKGVPQGYWPAGTGRIAFGPDGNLYQADGFDGVGCYSPTGSFLRRWRSPSTGGVLECPANLTFGADGTFFVLDDIWGRERFLYSRVKYFTAAGEFLGKLTYDGSARFKNLEDIAVSLDGTVYLADPTEYRILYFAPAAGGKSQP